MSVKSQVWNIHMVALNIISIIVGLLAELYSPLQTTDPVAVGRIVTAHREISIATFFPSNSDLTRHDTASYH